MTTEIATYYTPSFDPQTLRDNHQPSPGRNRVMAEDQWFRYHVYRSGYVTARSRRDPSVRYACRNTEDFWRNGHGEAVQ